MALALGVSVANSIEVILSSFLLTYWFGSPFNLSKRRPLLGFLGVSVLGATAITSAMGASWTLLFVDAGPWWKLFRTWYLGDILGMAIIAPLVFILLRPGFFEVFGRKQLGDTLVLLCVSGDCDRPGVYPRPRPADLLHLSGAAAGGLPIWDFRGRFWRFALSRWLRSA